MNGLLVSKKITSSAVSFLKWIMFCSDMLFSYIFAWLVLCFINVIFFFQSVLLWYFNKTKTAKSWSDSRRLNPSTLLPEQYCRYLAVQARRSACSGLLSCSDPDTLFTDLACSSKCGAVSIKIPHSSACFTDGNDFVLFDRTRHKSKGSIHKSHLFYLVKKIVKKILYQNPLPHLFYEDFQFFQSI